MSKDIGQPDYERLLEQAAVMPGQADDVDSSNNEGKHATHSRHSRTIVHVRLCESLLLMTTDPTRWLIH